MTTRSAVLLTLTALLVTAAPVPAADPPVGFLSDVAPVLRDNCFACHNPKKSAGRYDMTTFEKLLSGGSSGPGIVPGKAADSEFHQLVVSTDDRRMPPRDKGEPSPRPRPR